LTSLRAKLARIIYGKIDSYLEENTTHRSNEFWFLTRPEITQHNVNIRIKLTTFEEITVVRSVNQQKQKM